MYVAVLAAERKDILKKYIIVVVIFLTMVLTFVSCANNTKIENDISGPSQPNESLDVMLNSEITSYKESISNSSSIHITNMPNNRISAGEENSFIIKSDGSLWAWGGNSVGQIGDGTEITGRGNNNRTSPVKIMDDVTSVSAGSYHTFAIKSDGSLWAWGNNGVGQLGDGTIEHKSTPVKIMDDVIAVSAGSYHTLAIKSDSSLWAWGDNQRGQLGDGTTENSLIPIKIMDDVTAVSAGSYHSLVIKSDGSLWAWGWAWAFLGWSENEWVKRFGDGMTENITIPVKIMDDVIAVSAGDFHSLLIKSDGSLWAWGQNQCGQLGNGTITIWDYVKGEYIENNDKTIPTKVMNDVTAICAGDEYSLAIKSDGSLWAWGNNEYGQLGDGMKKNTPTPMKIMDDIIQVSAGLSHTMVIKTDGSLWTWGFNESGQLGKGSLLEFYETPMKIMDDSKFTLNTEIPEVTTNLLP